MSAEAAAVPGDPATAVVLDTNIVLDVFVFADTAAQPVRKAWPRGGWPGGPPRPCAKNWPACWTTRTLCVG